MTAPHDEQLSFRPMATDDLVLVQGWLGEPHVARWWGEPEPTEQMAETWTARVEGRDPVSPWIMEIEGVPVGFIQWYRVADEAAEWYPGVSVPEGTVAVDLAIGDPDYVGQGHGRRLLLEFCHHVLRAVAPDSPEVWIDPNPRNDAAVHAFRAAGFHDTGVDLPDPEHPGELRRLLRMAWAGPAFR
jgi:aminoglycoside 6'-N-acetyltransferase